MSRYATIPSTAPCGPAVIDLHTMRAALFGDDASAASAIEQLRDGDGFAQTLMWGRLSYELA